MNDLHGEVMQAIRQLTFDFVVKQFFFSGAAKNEVPFSSLCKKLSWLIHHTSRKFLCEKESIIFLLILKH